MTHNHCDTCFLIDCAHTSSCSLIYCPNGCFARMHECKRDDHEFICPNAIIPCINVNYGCSQTIQRYHLSQHLRVCPASVIICSFIYNRQYPSINLNKLTDSSSNKSLIDTIASRDCIWFEHIQEFERTENEMYADLRINTSRNKHVEHLIRSEKYRYITMRECMLSRGNGVICSTCRKHLRQLEENEDQRLAELTEGERKQMLDFNLNYDRDLDQTTIPSLVKMSSTLINASDMPIFPSDSSSSNAVTTEHDINSIPIISDTQLPSSHLYRLNFFSNNPMKNLKSFTSSPRFFCHALCRRDEIEQHWRIHFQIDCTLDTSLIQKCPKSQYGCTFEYERLELCQKNGQSIKIRFDQMNDAIAFDWYPELTVNEHEKLELISLPSEILTNILQRLDSLSLRNISLVCCRLRAICQCLLPKRGIVVSEYERNPSSHGGITWVEQKKHWLFTNTTSAIPNMQLKTPNKLTSMSQHLITCPYGEVKDLQNEPPFRLHAWNVDDVVLKTT